MVLLNISAKPIASRWNTPPSALALFPSKVLFDMTKVLIPFEETHPA